MLGFLPSLYHISYSLEERNGDAKGKGYEALKEPKSARYQSHRQILNQIQNSVQSLPFKEDYEGVERNKQKVKGHRSIDE
jgi:hypothetical protein